MLVLLVLCPFMSCCWDVMLVKSFVCIFGAVLRQGRSWSPVLCCEPRTEKIKRRKISMKKSTRLLSIVLAMLMVISMMPVAVFATTTALNGAGTEADPYQIGSLEDLIFPENLSLL